MQIASQPSLEERMSGCLVRLVVLVVVVLVLLIFALGVLFGVAFSNLW